MNSLVKYVIDIANSYKIKKLPQNLIDAGCTFDQIDKETSNYKHYIVINSEDRAWNISFVDNTCESDVLVIRYFNDAMDDPDTIFTINKDNISLKHQGNVYNFVTKDEFFNLSLSMTGKIISFDTLLELQKNIQHCGGIILLYVQDEELQYGYM